MHYAIQDLVHKTLGTRSVPTMHYEILCIMTLCIVRISTVGRYVICPNEQFQ